MSFKSIKEFQEGAQYIVRDRQATNRQTEHATKKWAAIGEIACAARGNAPKTRVFYNRAHADLFEASVKYLQFFARELCGSTKRFESFRFVSGHVSVAVLQFASCITYKENNNLFKSHCWRHNDIHYFPLSLSSPPQKKTSSWSWLSRRAFSPTVFIFPMLGWLQTQSNVFIATY